MRHLRVRLIDAVMRAEDSIRQAQEALRDILAISLELVAAGDEIESPPTSASLSDVPFKRETVPPGGLQKVSQRPTAYSHVALKREKIVAHMRKAFDEAESDTEREDVRGRMRRLVDQHIIEATDVADYLGVAS